MKKVPFYGNHEDNMHCAVAVYRMLFDYFLDRKLTWQEAEKMSGFQPGKAAWTVTMWERMSKQGFDIRMIEPFDYRSYEAEGGSYLRTYFTKTQYDWMLAHSNILEIRPLIASFLSQVAVEQRRATLDDLDEMLDDGRLVFLTLNAKALNGAEGYSDHAVLVIGKTADEYILHDPGTTPHPDRHVARQLLWEAMDKDKSTSEMTGVKFKPRPMRADLVLAAQYPLYSRAALAKLFDKQLIQLNGRALKSGDKILSNAVLDADLSSLQLTDTIIDLPILYENDDVVVMNKPTGVLTHSKGAFNPEATVATFVRKHISDGMMGERAGIVHRLDRATSGVIICAKTSGALSFLQKQFSQRRVKKTYNAVIQGTLDPAEAVIDMPIERNPKAPATFRVGPNGKSAVTHYKIIGSNATLSLLELKPETGRTHQLRVHLAHIGHPIVGDTLYDGAPAERLFLHARELEITLPNHERRTFTAPLPPEFSAIMK